MPILTPTRRKLLGNATWLYALQGLNYVLPLAVLPYLIRVLGIERYGLVAFAQSFAQYFVIITDYGFNLSATRRIAGMQDDRARVSRLFWAVMAIKLAMMAAGMAVLALIVFTVPRFRSDAVLYCVGYLAVVGTVLFPMWLFQGMEQMRFISFITGGPKLIAALALFVFIHRPSDYVLALGIQSAGVLVAGVAGFAIAIRHFGIELRAPMVAEIKDTLHDGWHLFVSTAATMAYTNSNVFLVGVFAGNTQAGYFSAAEKIIRGMQGLLGPVTQTIYPHVSGLAVESRESALVFLRKSLLWIGVLSFLPSAALYFSARPVARLLLGVNGAGSVAILHWIAMLPFVIAISNVLGIQTMIPFGLQKQLSRIYIAAGVGSLALSIPLIIRYGATGAGSAVLIIETVIVLLMWQVLRSHHIHILERSKKGPPAVAAKPFVRQESV